MQVTAISTTRHPEWRWRISDYAGTTVEVGRSVSLAYRVSTLAALVVLASSSIARAEVPKPEDTGACNAEEKEATRKGQASRGASPNADAQRRAADAGRGGGKREGRGGSAPASNPQLEGMDPA